MHRFATDDSHYIMKKINKNTSLLSSHDDITAQVKRQALEDKL